MDNIKDELDKLSESKKSIDDIPDIKELDYLNDIADNIIGYVGNVTGLKKKKDSNTIIINDVVIDNDGNLNDFTVQVEDISSKFMNFIHDNLWLIIVGIAFTAIGLLDIKLIISFLHSVVSMELDVIHISIARFFYFSIIAIGIWIWSTAYIYYCYHNRKKFLLYFIIGSILLHLYVLLYKAFYILLIPMISNLEVNELMTINKIIGLGKISAIIPPLIMVTGLTIAIIKGLSQENISNDINEFKITHYIRKPISKFEYNISIVRDLKTGKKIIIPEHDRWMHGETTGATGTAKTSSVFLPMIYNDLKTKALNEDTQKKAICKLVKEGKAYIEKPFNDNEFSPSMLYKNIKPVEGYEKEFKKKVMKYRSAGITVMAPDCSLTDKVCDLAESFGFNDYNRIDPLRDDEGNYKKNSIGSNPLHISPNIPKWAVRKEIVKKATLCADVMQIMYDMSSKSDPYFASVNRIATTISAMVVMLTHNIIYPNEIPKLSHVRDIINNFDLLNNYVPTLKTLNRQNNNIYTPILSIIEHEFLGPDKANFEKHCKGLRIQINNFLMHPEVERVLCADDTVDMDLMLEEGQVTTFNFELGDLGPVNSPAFGLFITINMINAVLRRKGTEWTRLPHFWFIDEFPVIVSPAMEQCFTLFRKYRTSMMVAIQTLDQMNKNPFLKYLKGIILNSCGFHIVFGRTNPNDQEIFSKLSGIVEKISYTESHNATSITIDRPTYSTQDRYTIQEKPFLNETEIRNRDFQEVSLFYVKDGRAATPRSGRVQFLKNRDFNSKKRNRYNWAALYQEQNPIMAPLDINRTDELKNIPKNVIDNDDIESATFISGYDINKEIVIDDDKNIEHTSGADNINVVNNLNDDKKEQVIATIDDDDEDIILHMDNI